MYIALPLQMDDFRQQNDKIRSLRAETVPLMKSAKGLMVIGKNNSNNINNTVMKPVASQLVQNVN